MKMPTKQHDLTFQQEIKRWDEALPLGNGKVGCLIWGNAEKLRFSLDRADLWDTRPAPEVLDPGFKYSSLVDLVDQGDQASISRRFSDFFTQYPYPTKLPAGRIECIVGHHADNMKFKLNIREALAEVEWHSEGSMHRLESFLHADTGLGHIRLQGEKANLTQLQLVSPDYSGAYAVREDEQSSFDISLASLGYPNAEFSSDGNTVWFCQQTNHDLVYAIVIARRQYSEEAIEWVYQFAANLDGEDWLEQAIGNVRSVAAGYASARSGHAAWWRQYWQQSTLTVSEFEIEKMWYVTNYLFGSCSRKGAPPMPLQGVWTADEGYLPPWKGDYHHDLNTQMSYWHYLKANRLREGESFIDFLWSLRPVAREFAQTFYGTSGINLPSVMTIEGQPLGGWAMYSLSPTNQIWLCQAFDHYWLYTGDREFLETQAYVYMKETAMCLLDLLKPGEEDKLYLPLSSTPEVHDDSLRAWLTPNSNYDLSLLRYLFARLEQLSRYLGLEEEGERWNSTLSRLPDLAVNQTGLMLASDEELTESHRHFSHAMAIYPLQLLDYRRSAEDKEMIDRTIVHLERLGKGYWCGYSFAWMAALYTRQGNGEAARHHLQQFWKYMCSPNGFHLNGDYKVAGITQFHYRPFTLEGNMAAADALQEMLLQTNNGVIRPFPAVPREWLENGVEFERFRGEMGIVVSAKALRGKVEFVKLKAERDGVYKLENRFATEQLLVVAEERSCVVQAPVHSELSISLLEGQSCTITSFVSKESISAQLNINKG